MDSGIDENGVYVENVLKFELFQNIDTSTPGIRVILAGTEVLNDSVSLAHIECVCICVVLVYICVVSTDWSRLSVEVSIDDLTFEYPCCFMKLQRCPLATASSS